MKDKEKKDIHFNDNKNFESISKEEEAIEKHIEKLEQSEQKKQKEQTWDGTESEFVEDDEASEFEEPYSGIKLNYVLKKAEIEACLRSSGFFKTGKIRSMVEICLLIILAILFFVSYSKTYNNLNLGLGLVSVICLVVVVVLPRIAININATKMATGKKLEVEIYPDKIEVNCGDGPWDILLDGTAKFKEHENLFFLFLEQDQVFVIPKRAIEPDFLADVEATLRAGTK